MVLISHGTIPRFNDGEHKPIVEHTIRHITTATARTYSQQDRAQRCDKTPSILKDRSETISSPPILDTNLTTEPTPTRPGPVL